jgi:hypothetical protein
MMAIRAIDSDGYKFWAALGTEQLGRDVAGEVESEWMVPLLVEAESDRLMAWQLGVSLLLFEIGEWCKKIIKICEVNYIYISPFFLCPSPYTSSQLQRMS